MISPWQQYDTQPPWKFPLLLDGSPLVVAGLSPESFQLILHPTDGGQEIIGSGPFSDLVEADPSYQGSPPSIIYHEKRADVAIIGQYRAWLLITYDDGEQETLNLGHITIQGR